MNNFAYLMISVSNKDAWTLYERVKKLFVLYYWECIIYDMMCYVIRTIV